MPLWSSIYSFMIILCCFWSSGFALRPTATADRRWENRHIRWRFFSMLKQRWGSRSLMLHWRGGESCTWKTVWSCLLWKWIIIATCYVHMLSRIWCWVSTCSCRYRIWSKRQSRGREVTVAWGPSWVGTQILTRLMGVKAVRNNDQWKHHLWVDGKADVQIHLGNRKIDM